MNQLLDELADVIGDHWITINKQKNGYWVVDYYNDIDGQAQNLCSGTKETLAEALKTVVVQLKGQP